MKKFFKTCKNNFEKVFFWKTTGKIAGMCIVGTLFCLATNLTITAIPLAVVGAVTLGMSVESVREDNRVMKCIEQERMQVSEYKSEKQNEQVVSRSVESIAENTTSKNDELTR